MIFWSLVEFLTSLLYASGLFPNILCITVVIHNMYAVVLWFALLPLHPLSFPQTNITHVLSAKKPFWWIFLPFLSFNSDSESACIYTSAKIFLYLVNFRY